jgi:GT2 family glycosyltransferase
MQHEETDLCWRLKLKGYKILYSGKSHIYHVGGAHLSYEDPKKNFLNFRNNCLLEVPVLKWTEKSDSRLKYYEFLKIITELRKIKKRYFRTYKI